MGTAVESPKELDDRLIDHDAEHPLYGLNPFRLDPDTGELIGSGPKLNPPIIGCKLCERRQRK